MGEELTTQQKHDLGHELTDGDVRELERGEEQVETDKERAEREEDENAAGVVAPTDAETFTKDDQYGHGYTRDSDGVRGSFGPNGFEPYES